MVQDHDAEAPAMNKEINPDHLFKVTGLSSNNLEKISQESELPADFETAIAATGFGKFNIMLMLFALPLFWTAVSLPSSVSYIFTKAKCDLNLSLLDMGTLNAATYGGMISSGMMWGFISDTLGRKKLIVWGCLASSFCEITAGLSQNFGMLVTTKFICGFVFNGPDAVMLSYLAEMHRTDLRARIMLLTSMFYSLASTGIPLLAWAWLTHDIEFHLFGGWIAIRSWNLFLLTMALMPAVAGVAFTLMPESPKFLMSRGRNDEAMLALKKLYAMNTGNAEEDYPIKRLIEEKSEKQAEGFAALRGGFGQLAPLFKPPHLKWLLLLCIIHLGLVFNANTLRLWFPQLAAMIHSSEEGDLCAAIAPKTPVSQALTPEDEICVPIEMDMMTYLQSVVVGSGSVFTYIIGGMVVNKCGKKIVASTCALIGAAICIMLPYFGSTSSAVVAMVTVVLSLTALCAVSLSTVIVDLFPTSLRVMALALFLISGKLGSIIGTITFPALIEFGCYLPFYTIAFVVAGCGLACYAIPNTTLKKLG